MRTKKLLFACQSSGPSYAQPYDIPDCLVAFQANQSLVALGNPVGPWVDVKGLADAVQTDPTKQGIMAVVGGETAIQMDGIDDYYAVADVDELNFRTDSFTIAARWYSDGTPGHYTSIMDKYKSGLSIEKGYYIRYSVDDIHLGMATGTTSELIVSAGEEVSAGWRTAIVTRNGDVIEFFINGVSQGTLSGQASRMCMSTDHLYLNKRYGYNAYGDIAYAGVWAFDRVLTPTELLIINTWRSV